MPARFLCALSDILNSYALAGIGCVIIAIVRDINDTYEFVVDHDSLGTVFAGAFRFIHISARKKAKKVTPRRVR